jgi:hypothetical protein
LISVMARAARPSVPSAFVNKSIERADQASPPPTDLADTRVLPIGPVVAPYRRIAGGRARRAPVRVRWPRHPDCRSWRYGRARSPHPGSCLIERPGLAKWGVVGVHMPLTPCHIFFGFLQSERGLALAGTFCPLHLPAIPTFLPCVSIVLDRPTTKLPGGI